MDVCGWSQPEAIAQVQVRWLDEISGLAVGKDRKDEEIAWVIEDSGNAPALVAIRLTTGEVVSRLKVSGQQNVDWEDLAIGACPAEMAEGTGEAAGDAGLCAWIGEFGDNRAARDDLALIVVRLPEGTPKRGRVEALRVPLVWPDGKHDTEAMAFAPDGSLHFWSKLRDGTAQGYRLTPDQLLGASPTATLTPTPTTRVGVLKDGVYVTAPDSTSGPANPVVPWRATAAAWVGEGYVLRTYEAAWLYSASPVAESVEPVEPVRTPVPAPIEPQAEAIAWDGRSLWFVSEIAGSGVAPTIWRVARSCGDPSVE